MQLLKRWPKLPASASLLIIVSFAITLGIRVGGLLLFFYLWLFALGYWCYSKVYKKEKPNLFRLLLILIGISSAAYFLGLIFLPKAHASFLQGPFASLKYFTHYKAVFLETYPTLFMGKYYTGHVPWYYIPWWILISSPPIFLFGIIVFLATSKMVWTEYRKRFFLLLFVSAIFPVLYVIVKQSLLYHSWRHLFFVYPPMVILSALGWEMAFRKSPRIPALVLAAFFLFTSSFTIAWSVKNHPHQHAYMNFLVGGLKGAFGQYELDYWGQCAGSAADKLADYFGEKKIQPPYRFHTQGINLVGAYRLRSRLGDRYDAAWTHDWRYKVEFFANTVNPSTINGKEGENIILTVEADEVPLCIVREKREAQV
jgi:hypothetical protein